MKAISPYVTGLKRRPLLIVVVMTAVFALMTVNALMQKSAPSGPALPPGPAVAEAVADPAKTEPATKEGAEDNSPIVDPDLITVTTYAFTNASAVALEDMSSGTTQLVAANLDDTASAVTNIGFEFWYDGVRMTQFSVNANGLCRMGGTAVSTSFDNSTGFASTTNAPKIAPYYDDLWVGTNGKVHFKVIGSAPSRKLVVEWLNMQIPRVAAGNPGAGTFQMWLFETTGVIEYVYGSGVALNSANSGYSIGLQSGGATNFASVTSTGPTVSYAAANNTQTNAITSGTKYTFTPNVPAAPTGLNFTAVTAVSMTLNWTDVATNEFGYAIYQSNDGGVNYSFVTQTAANAVSQAISGLNPSTTYFFKVYAVTEGALSTALSGSQLTAAPGNLISVQSGLWNDTATWGGTVPTATDNVTIATGHTVTINSSNALSVTVQSGAILQFEDTTARTLTVGQSVTIDSGGTFQTASTLTQTGHVLSVGGNLTNNGTLDFSTNANTAGAGITFTGAANNTFSGTGATTDVRTITINKGVSSANILDLTSTNFTVQGVNTDVAGFLTLTNGTFKISGAFTMTNRIFASATYIIPATGGLWMNNANFTVPAQAGGTTTQNNGLFRMTQGTYGIGVTGADGMGGGTGAVFIVEGGLINATRIDPQNAVSWTQSGGTINVGLVANTRSAFATFELFSTTSTFTMSGGTINLVQASVAATPIDWQVRSANPTVTGGVVNVGTGATTTNFNFRLRANVPNFVIDNTTNNKTATATAQVNLYGTTTISTGTTLVIDGQICLVLGPTFTNNGTLTGTAAATRYYFLGGLGPTTYTGTGVVTTPLLVWEVDNVAGVTINPSVNQIITLRYNNFSGGLTGSGKLTIGNGGATTSVVQLGVAAAANPVTGFDVAPVFNPGTGGAVNIYAQELTGRTTGNEILPSRTLAILSASNTNGVTISGGDITVNGAGAGALTMTNAPIKTGPNTLYFNSAAGTVVRTLGGFVNGNFKKSYAAAASKSFEVGTANGFSPVTVSLTAGTFPADFTVKAVQGPQPNVADPAKALQRYWKLTGTGVTADLTFNYLDPIDIPVTATEANFAIFAYDTSGTFPGGTVTPATNMATITGVTMFSDWTLLESGACPTTIDKGSQSYPANGGMDSFMVAATGGCSWTATSNDPGFITVTSGSGMGNGAVNYTVAANPSTTMNRAGSITIGSRTFIIVQGIAFVDVPPGSPFYNEIGKLSARGVTLGCSSGNYCPNDSVTRDQMAAFIIRSLGEFSPPTPATQRFSDVLPGTPFYNFIDRMAVLGITLGCAPNMYCPADPVKRDAMAAFIIRGLGEFNPPTPMSQRFGDVLPGTPFYNFIDRMAVLNITLGCQAGMPPNYCPNDTVIRASMAAFLVRAFKL